jgi:hypothetical protein
VLALISGSLLLAFGSYTPVYPFLYEWIPVFRALRFPEKYYYLTFALLIFATVRGLRQVDGGENYHTSWVVATSILAVWLISYASFRWQPQWLAESLQPANLNQVFPSADPTTIAAILVILEKQVGISLVLAVLFCLHRLGVIRKGLLQCFLVLTVFFDLNSANKPLHFLRDATLTESIQRILGKPLAEPGRLFYYPAGENLHPSYVRVTGSPDYAKATEISLNNLLPNAGMLFGFEYFQDIDALGRRTYTNFLHFINALPPERRGKLLGAVNVNYVVAFHPLEVKGLKFVREFPEHYSRLYEVTDTVPRTYVAARAIHERDPQSVLRRLSTDEFDLLREVIVDIPIPLPPKGVFQGNAAIKLYRNNRVQIDAQLSEPGILVLTDAFYPGWKARVDGQERKILRANYLFRAVELPAGNHKVEFIYDPESFKIGLAISLFTIGLLVTVPLIGWFRLRAQAAKVTNVISKTPRRLVAE